MYFYVSVLYVIIDQTLVNSLHGLLNCELGGLECRVTTKDIYLVSIVYTCNTYVVMHWSMQFISLVSGRYSYVLTA